MMALVKGEALRYSWRRLRGGAQHPREAVLD